ncbi:MAG TPA: hypothetical protein VGU71_06375 [Candidatus Dormibacteraeota bacterium]|nr:hypothetical protein [Candidatus Dormibacteraeota bacterium]
MPLCGSGHNLGLRVVAEGLLGHMVEAMLVEAGCDARAGVSHRAAGARA